MLPKSIEIYLLSAEWKGTRMSYDDFDEIENSFKNAVLSDKEKNRKKRRIQQEQLEEENEAEIEKASKKKTPVRRRRRKPKLRFYIFLLILFIVAVFVLFNCVVFAGKMAISFINKEKIKTENIKSDNAKKNSGEKKNQDTDIKKNLEKKEAWNKFEVDKVVYQDIIEDSTKNKRVKEDKSIQQGVNGIIVKNSSDEKSEEEAIAQEEEQDKKENSKLTEKVEKEKTAENIKGFYSIQVFMSADVKAMEKVVDNFKKKGYMPYYVQEGGIYNILIGKFKTREEAITFGNRLQNKKEIDYYYPRYKEDVSALNTQQMKK